MQTEDSRPQMASIIFSISSLLCFFTVLSRICFSAGHSVIDDLNNLKPPENFNETITNNCINNPSLRYCNAQPFDLLQIFQSTIVASHLCNISGNPNCVESFPKIDLHNKPKIAPLYLSFDFFWKYCPLTILSVDVSNNSLQGRFPSQVFYCSQLHRLDLSNNSLSGDVPIQSFSALPNLTFLNLSYNFFGGSGKVNPDFFKRFNASSFIHSGIVIDDSEFRLKVVILLIVFPLSVLAIASFLFWFCLRRPEHLPCSCQSGRDHKFTPLALKAATNGFSRKNLVATSDSLDSYHGQLRDGSEVRVDVYKDGFGSDDRRIFEKGCNVLTHLSHRSIVGVMGWCDSGNLRAIVSEWLDGENNVESWLAHSAPSWKHRTRVITGILEGVRYVHEECPEIECDLKTSKIILNDCGEPVISTFKVDEESSTTNKIYKFGVFVLEMVSNRRPLEEFESGEVGFVRWIKLHYPHEVQALMDERMKKTEVIVKEAVEIIQLGLSCADESGVREQPRLEDISYVVSKYSTRVSQPSAHTRLPRSGYQRSKLVKGKGKGKLVQQHATSDDDLDV